MTHNPLEPVGNLLVDHPIALAIGLGVVSSTVAGWYRVRTTQIVEAAGHSHQIRPTSSDLLFRVPARVGRGRRTSLRHRETSRHRVGRGEVELTE